MTRVLVDSDVLVDHLRGHRTYERGVDDPHISVVSRSELFAGRRTQERRVRQLIDSMVELPVDRTVAERAGRIRRATGLRQADAIIAATAIEHRLVLVTRNVRDFGRVPGLRIRAPDG